MINSIMYTIDLGGFPLFPARFGPIGTFEEADLDNSGTMEAAGLEMSQKWPWK